MKQLQSKIGRTHRFTVAATALLSAAWMGSVSAQITAGHWAGGNIQTNLPCPDECGWSTISGVDGPKHPMPGQSRPESELHRCAVPRWSDTRWRDMQSVFLPESGVWRYCHQCRRHVYYDFSECLGNDDYRRHIQRRQHRVGHSANGHSVDRL